MLSLTRALREIKSDNVNRLILKSFKPHLPQTTAAT